MKWSGAGWLAVRWLLAGVFLWAGCSKLSDAAGFAASIHQFRMVPDPLVNSLALSLPPLEILCGLALFAGPWKRPAAFGLMILCAIFLAALLSAAARGLSVDCSCFGAASAESISASILRDVLLFATAAAIWARLCRTTHVPAFKERHRAL